MNGPKSPQFKGSAIFINSFGGLKKLYYLCETNTVIIKKKDLTV
jgi:hypothetical protein